VYGTPPPPPSDTPGSRGQRYAYLAARLQNRQITMEEATELFTVMQAMIARANEAARAAAARASGSVPAALPPASVREAPRREAPSGGSADDLLLVGILAMGAGAGLLAALSKRIADTNAPAPPPSGSRPKTGAPSS
jgi:predicted acylesterase/phospholipase RssA